MILFYLDASAWVKRYVREAGSDWLLDVFAGQTAFACASLGFIEVMAALYRKRKAGQLEQAVFDDTIQALREDWQGFAEVHLTDEVLTRAGDVVRRFALRGADAVHLASALILRERFKDTSLVFVVSDQELKTAAQAAGFVVLDPVIEEQTTADRPTQG